MRCAVFVVWRGERGWEREWDEEGEEGMGGWSEVFRRVGRVGRWDVIVGSVGNVSRVSRVSSEVI